MLNFQDHRISISPIQLLAPALLLASVSLASPPTATVPPFVFGDTDLSLGTTAYRPLFYGNTGLGDLVQYTVSSTGELSTDVDWDNATHSNPTPTNSGNNWSAQRQFKKAIQRDSIYWRSKRKVIFRNNAGSQKDFFWTKLDTNQQNLLRSAKIVNYVRGDQSNEIPNGSFRKRAALMGSIVNSNALYLGSPNAIHADTTYEGFFNHQQLLTPRVVVGANDGMVHVFNANTGNEIFAYIPSMIMHKLASLADSKGQTLALIDGPITSSQVYGRWANGTRGWRTVVAGGLGAGGKGFYALDLTRTGKNNKILWELSHNDDPVIGFTHGHVQMARFEDGKFYAIAGNGYGSGSGESALLVIDPTTGDILKTISYAGGGLSSPTLVDSDNNHRIDRVYAGDIDGNLFRYDVTSVDPAQWRIHNGQNEAPLFNANGRPITIAPSVSYHPIYGHLISFGTGKLTSSADLALTQQEYIIGLWDKGAPINFTNLLQQTVFNKSEHTGANGEKTSVRTLSAARPGLNSFSGWRVALPIGMRLIDSPAFVRAKRLKMTLADVDIASGSIVHWAAEFDYAYGGAAESAIYDLNGDRKLDTDDLVNGKPPMLVQLKHDAVSGPSVARIGNGVDLIVRNSINLGKVVQPPKTCVDFTCAGSGHFDYDTYHNSFGGNTHDHFYGEAKWKNGKCSGAPSASLFEPMGYKHDKGPCKKDAKQVKEKRGVSRVTGPSFPAAQELVVLMTNADLSPGVYIQVGENVWRATEYQRLIQTALEQWAGGALTTPDGKPLTVTSTQLSSLNTHDIHFFVEKNAFDKNSILGGEPGCYKDKKLENGRWRNGAISAQVVPWDYLKNSATTAVDMSKLASPAPQDLPSAIFYPVDNLTVVLRETGISYGGLVLSGKVPKSNDSTKAFFEGTIYHHDKTACYGESGFSAPLDYDVPQGHMDHGESTISVTCSGSSTRQNCGAFSGIITTGSGNQNGGGGGGGASGGGSGNNGGSAGPFAMPIPLQSVTPGPKLMPGRKAWIDMVPK